MNNHYRMLKFRYKMELLSINLSNGQTTLNVSSLVYFKSYSESYENKEAQHSLKSQQIKQYPSSTCISSLSQTPITDAFDWFICLPGCDREVLHFLNCSNGLRTLDCAFQAFFVLHFCGLNSCFVVGEHPVTSRG